jgi:2TM domain
MAMTTEYKVYKPTDGPLQPIDTTDDELRKRAVKRIQAKAGFWTHLAVYLAVNGFLVTIWFFTGAGYFWPIFPIAGWGIGIAANAWDVFGREPITEERVQREMDELRR